MKKISVWYSPEVAVTDVEIEIQKSVLKMCGGEWTPEAFQSSKYNIMELLANIFAFKNGYESIKNQIAFDESELEEVLFATETALVQVPNEEWWIEGRVNLTVVYFE